MAAAGSTSMSAIERRKAWTAATRRRNEIINLAKHRAAHGGPIDKGAFIFTIAQTLASAPEGKYRIQSRFVTYHGLDRASLARSVYEAGFGQIGCDDDLIERALADVQAGPAMRSDTAGRLLKLTAEERDLLSIRTIEAVDEGRADREGRRREERRMRDTERKRRARAGMCQPRAEYLAKSLSAQKPWTALGISKATYYRQRAANETGLSAATYNRETGLSVRQVCPPTHIINGCADRLVSPIDDAAHPSSLQRSNSSLCPSDGADVAPRHERLIGEEQKSPFKKNPPAASAAAPEGRNITLSSDEMAIREEVIAQLAGGDLRKGRRLAEFVSQGAMQLLVMMAGEHGVQSCADEIAIAARMAGEALASAIRNANSSNLLVEP